MALLLSRKSGSNRGARQTLAPDEMRQSLASALSRAQLAARSREERKQ
jgi:hypothetical protein